MQLILPIFLPARQTSILDKGRVELDRVKRHGDGADQLVDEANHAFVCERYDVVNVEQGRRVIWFH